MKYLLLLLFVIGCTNSIEPVAMIEQAEVFIINIGTNEEDTIILFDIENTGNVKIDNWYVIFRVATEDSIFYPDKGGIDLYIGKTKRDRVVVGTLDPIMFVDVIDIKY